MTPCKSLLPANRFIRRFPFLSNVLYLSKGQCPQSCMFFFGSSISLTFTRSRQYARITQSRITTSFFIFSLIYLCAQCVLQSLFFSLDKEYATLVSRIIKAGNLPPQNFTYIQSDNGHLRLQMCDDIPFGRNHPCTTIFDSSLPPIQVRSIWD